MITIEMGNVVSKFYGLNIETKSILLESLSYTIGGFGVKKSTKNLFNPDSSMTYTGLVPHTLKTFSQLGLQYKIIDKRTKPIQNGNFKLLSNFKARDYQQEIIHRASSREIVQCATGGGKTFILGSLIVKFDTKPVLIVAPKVSLALQLKSEISKFLGIKVGIVGGGQHIVEDITVTTPLSATEELIENAKVLLFDECHNIPSNTIYNLARKAINAYYRIGVSATPWRDGGDDILIEAVLNIRKPNLSINASKLIAKGQLTPCTINFINIDSKVNWQGNYNDTYQKAIVKHEMRNQTIVKLTKKVVDNNRSSLILISKIEHGELLLEKIKQQIDYEEKLYYDKTYDRWFTIGTVEFVSGKDDLIKREVIFQAVKDGFCKVLIGSTIADEGLDLPRLDTLILAGAGKSSTRAFQRVGRVLRLYKNKTRALIFDFIDSNETFYNQAQYRKALYETEPLWKINYLDVNQI